jgi:hypothetical protein
MTGGDWIEVLGPVALGAFALAGIATVAAIIRHHLDTPRCLACDEALRDGQEVYADVSGGIIHAACCGPERESYVGADGEPLRDDEPIPTPWRWSRDLA